MPEAKIKPTKKDREKLEILAELINDLSLNCGCGEDESCSYCDVDLNSDDIYVCGMDYDRLRLSIRLKNVDAQSKLAQRYNSQDEVFSDLVDWVDKNIDTVEELHNLYEVFDLIECINTNEEELTPSSKPIKQI